MMISRCWLRLGAGEKVNCSNAEQLCRKLGVSGVCRYFYSLLAGPSIASPSGIDRMQLVANPTGQSPLRESTVGNALHRRDDIRLSRVQVLSVQAKERVGAHECRALVAIHETMIPRETKRVGGGQSRDVHAVPVGSVVAKLKP